MIPHRVENNVNAFSPGQFRCGNKVAISQYEHNLVHKPLVAEGRDIQTKLHIDAFLSGHMFYVVFVEFIGRDAFPQQAFYIAVLEPPLRIGREISEPKRKLAMSLECAEKRQSELSFSRLRQMNAATSDWILYVLGHWRTIVVQNSIQLGLLRSFVEVLQ